MASITPSLVQLRRAITISEKIEALQAELHAILGGSAGISTTGKRKYTKRAVAEGSEEEAAPAKAKKRKMSPEAREKIAAAQRKRWAKSNKEKAKQAKEEAAKAE